MMNDGERQVAQARNAPVANGGAAQAGTVRPGEGRDMRRGADFVDRMVRSTTPQWAPARWFVPAFDETLLTAPSHRFPVHLVCIVLNNLWTLLLVQQGVLTLWHLAVAWGNGRLFETVFPW